TTLATHLRTLDRLAVQTADAGSGRTRLACVGVERVDPDTLTQSRVQFLPGAVVTPLGKVVVDGLPRAELLGEHPPRTARFVAVEDAIHDRSQVNRAGSAPMREGNQRLQYRPLFVGHVARVGFAHPLFLGFLPKQALRLRSRSSTKTVVISNAWIASAGVT